MMCKASVTALRCPKDCFIFQEPESRTVTNNNLIGDDVNVSRVYRLAYQVNVGIFRFQ